MNTLLHSTDIIKNCMGKNSLEDGAQKKKEKNKRKVFKMGFDDDAHLDVCQNIEVGLKMEYEKNEKIIDRKTIIALENAKIAVKQAFGYAKNEKNFTDNDTKGIIEWCISIGKERINKVNNLTLKEYVSRIDKIKRSVEHHSSDGKQGYYEFMCENG